jgi:hypothetical protein
MYRIFILALIAVLSGCSGTTMVRSSYSQPEKIVQAERWEPIMEDSKINVDVNYQYEMKLSNGRLLR